MRTSTGWCTAYRAALLCVVVVVGPTVVIGPASGRIRVVTWHPTSMAGETGVEAQQQGCASCLVAAGAMGTAGWGEQRRGGGPCGHAYLGGPRSMAHWTLPLPFPPRHQSTRCRPPAVARGRFVPAVPAVPRGFVVMGGRACNARCRCHNHRGRGWCSGGGSGGCGGVPELQWDAGE